MELGGRIRAYYVISVENKFSNYSIPSCGFIAFCSFLPSKIFPKNTNYPLCEANLYWTFVPQVLMAGLPVKQTVIDFFWVYY